MTFGKEESHFNLRSRCRVIIRVRSICWRAPSGRSCMFIQNPIGYFFRQREQNMPPPVLDVWVPKVLVAPQLLFVNFI